MGQKLKNAPVFFTIGQVQHNPLLSLGSYIPQIQERMRLAGYPGFEQSTQVRVAIKAAPENPEENGLAPSLQKHDSYVFTDLDGVNTFILQANSISFQTTVYDCFEAFYERFEQGLGLLNDVVGGLSFVERLGLRYADAVAPKETEELSQYLAPHLLGLPAIMEDSSFNYSFTESQLLSEDGDQVIARAVIQNGRLGVPPDIGRDTLKLQSRFEEISGPHATLDTDGFRVERRPYEISDVRSRMSVLHELIARCFKASVTDYARESWNQ